jgi:hypothetical protein
MWLNGTEKKPNPVEKVVPSAGSAVAHPVALIRKNKSLFD